MITELSPGPVETPEVSCLIDDSDTPIKVPFAINNPKAEMLVMTGWGDTNVAKVTERLGEEWGFSVAVCNIAYPTDRELTPKVIEQTTVRGTRAAVAALNRQAGRPEDSPIIGVAHSKGSSDQILAASRDPKLWSLLIESASFGLNTRFLGDTFKTQRRELNKRLQETDLLEAKPVGDFSLYNVDLDYVHLLREFMAGIKYGLAKDGVAMVTYLRKLGLMSRLFVGAEDPVFQPAEFESALGDDGFVVRIPDAGHESLLTDKGSEYIAKVIKLGISAEMRNPPAV